MISFVSSCSPRGNLLLRLRFINTAIKINYEFEPMGDMAVNVCKGFWS